MKHLTRAFNYKTLLTFLMISFLQAMAFAQDSTGGTSSSSSNSSTSTTTTTETHDWYTQPWVWIVGGAVLLLLIVALVRSNSSSSGSGTTDKVTYTKKVERDDTV
jgi:cell division protein FtsW (lipid II flippase)